MLVRVTSEGVRTAPGASRREGASVGGRRLTRATAGATATSARLRRTVGALGARGVTARATLATLGTDAAIDPDTTTIAEVGATSARTAGTASLTLKLPTKHRARLAKLRKATFTAVVTVDGTTTRKKVTLRK